MGKIDLKKIFILSDSVPALVILIGLFIAIFLHEMAIRLIGISVAILGGVALFMLISQRISEIVETKHTSKDPPQNFKVTKKRSASAKSTVFEDFSDSFGTASEQIRREAGTSESKPKPVKYENESVMPKADFMSSDEGFRIVTKPVASPQTAAAQNLNSGVSARSPIVPQQSEATPGLMEIDNISEITAHSETAREFNYEIADETSDKIIQPKIDQSINYVTPEITSKFTANESDRAEKKDFELFPSSDDSSKSTKSDLKLEITYLSDKKPEAIIQDSEQAGLSHSDEGIAIHEPPAVSLPSTTDITIQAQRPAEQAPESLPQKPALEAVEQTFEDATKKYKETIFDTQLSFLTEDIPLAGSEPRKEFEYFLNRVLMTIRSVTNTRTATFVLINSEKKELILISYETDVKNKIIPRTKFPLGNDVISQIIMSRKPEILTEINPSAELDLIPYYIKPVGTLSFIGVPVIYNNTVIGVLTADTNVLDAYDGQTVTFFGHFTKLISALVLSYTDKYDLLQASRTLDAITRFREFVNNPAKSINDIIESLIDSTGSLVDFTTLGICGYDESNGGWYVKTKKGKDAQLTSVNLDSPILVESSLIGESIINNKTLLIAPFDNDIVRVYTNEPKLDNGYFVAVPIQLKSISSTYGALFIEGNNTGSLTSFDINILETLCDHAGSNIEKLHFIDVMQSAAMFDSATGMLNPPAFIHRFEEEYFKSREFKIPISLCLMRIDKYASYDPVQYSSRMEKALYHVLNIARKHIRQYDVFGRLDANTYGIVLFGMKVNEAKGWAERLRKEIAISILEIEGKRFNVTISLGLADADSSNSCDTLFNNSRKVLDKSLERTNTVTVFS